MSYSLKPFITRGSLYALSALSLLVFSGASLHADTLSVLPISADGCYSLDNHYAFIDEIGFWCMGGTFTQSGNTMTVSAGLIGPDPWQDTGGTWTFDLSTVESDGSGFAYTTATAPVRIQWDIDGHDIESVSVPGTLYVAGVPIPSDPTSVPEPASFGLIALPVLLMIGFRERALRAL